MDLTHDLSDCRPLDEVDENAPTGIASAAATHNFNNIAALAYARWERLRGRADLPAVGDEILHDSRFRTPNCIQIAWDEHVATPTVAYLGDDLTGQLAGLAGEAWPNVPVESPLVELLRRISRHAIDERHASEFDEQIVDSDGWITDWQGLALPFTGNEHGAYLVDIMFDLDDPIVGEPMRRPAADNGILLLEQELDPDEMPRPVQASLPAPVLFVCVSDAAKQPPGRHPQEKSGARSRVPPLAAARARWRRSSRNSASAEGISASEPTSEPLLLIQPWEAVSDEVGSHPPPIRPSAPDHLLLSLQSARKQAEKAKGSEERSHFALYAALGAAHDFALLAAAAPERLLEIVTEAGLKMQARAPMTPIAKLIFGAGYDRSRLAEYALALSHAFRLRLPPGSLADYLMDFDGGLKGIVKAERQLHRASEPQEQSRAASLEAKLRKAAVRPLDSLEPAGQEFTLVMARRLPDGTVALLGEVPPDERLFRAAARKFLKG